MITPMKPSPIFIFESFVYITDDIVPGVIPNAYLVSNYGRLWSNRRNIFMHGTPDKDGYIRTALRLVDGNAKHVVMHRLVAKAFIPLPDRVDIPPEELVVNHKDGNKTNNFVGNLEWCSTYENTRHAIETGINTYYGERVINSNFTKEQVKYIADRLLLNMSYAEICKSIGLIPTENNTLLIGRIKTRYTYSRYTEDYDFSRYYGHPLEELIFTEPDVYSTCAVLQQLKQSGTDIFTVSPKEIIRLIGKEKEYSSVHRFYQSIIDMVIERIKNKQSFPEIYSQYDY